MTLESIVQTVYDQVYPNGADDAAVSKIVMLEAARVSYVYRVWELNRADMNATGENNIPSNLLTEGELKVVNGEADITKLGALTSLPNISWIQSIGGFECGECKYILMDTNKYKLLCDDFSRKIGDKVVIPLRNKLKFPEGTFTTDGIVPIIYANMGKGVNGKTEINEALGYQVRMGLLKEFGVKFPEDKTNDSNGNTKV